LFRRYKPAITRSPNSLLCISAPETQFGGTKKSLQYSGAQTILDLAEKSNKTFLKLIGLAIQNLKCELSFCDQWSEWTSEMVYRGQFGVKSVLVSAGTILVTRQGRKKLKSTARFMKADVQEVITHLITEVV